MRKAPFIGFHPEISWRRLFAPPGPMAAVLAGHRLFNYARDALYWAYRGLGLPPGTPAWMPSFHCGMEVRAAVDAGFAPRFYRVGTDLAIDEEHLVRALRREPGPVTIIHYFGFGQPAAARLAGVCRELAVPLVEDASHAFLSRHEGRALGTFGPLAAFSLYKSLGTLDGGALRCDGEALADLLGRPPALPPAVPRGGWPRDAWLEGVRRGLRGPGWLRELRHRRFTGGDETAFAARAARSYRRIFDGRRDHARGITRASERLISTLDPEEIVRRRRRNYLELDARLRERHGYRPVFAELGGGVCPLYLPIRVGQRIRWLNGLEAQRIRPFIFGMFHHPAMDAAAFPQSKTLRETVLCLPVHQGLSEADVERLAGAVAALL